MRFKLSLLSSSYKFLISTPEVLCQLVTAMCHAHCLCVPRTSGVNSNEQLVDNSHQGNGREKKNLSGGG